MAIQLTAEQEQRVQAVIGSGGYATAQEVLDAALMAVEQHSIHGLGGKDEELNALLSEGLAAKTLSEDQFWESVDRQTDALLAQHANRRHS